MSRDALIVGINQYQHLSSLTTAAHDAEAVSHHLETWGEFRVNRLPETIRNRRPIVSSQSPVSARSLEQALIKLFKPTGKNIPQTALFYYSGHGLQRQAGIREGYLATSDADPNRGQYGVSLFWLRRLLQESPVRQRIIILDCCHSGELLNFLEADPGACEGTDRLFMASSREYESAYESLEGPYSVFTQALLAGLDPSSALGGAVSNHHLIQVVSQKLRGEIQQPLFESSGSSIILTRTPGSSGVVCAPTKPLIERLQKLRYSFCPFPGSAAFSEQYADYFFGRETITDALVKQVHQSRLCTLVGPTGSGKTSLLRAGVLPQLRQLQTSQGWSIRYITPGQHPLRRISEMFVAPEVNDIQRAEQIYRAEAFLSSNPAGIGTLLQATLGAPSLQSPQQVLIIDQLEELWAVGVNPQERECFLSCLEAALRSQHLPLRIVLGVRAHTMSQLRPYRELYGHLSEHRIDLPPMTYEEVKSTIVKPLEKLSLAYDANLIYTLLLDIVGAPGELALLQQLLKELWTQRQIDPNGELPPCLTLDAYAALGGIRQLISHQASQFYQHLTPAEQAAARHIFIGLSEPGAGTEDRRRPVSLSQLVTDSFCRPQIEALLNRLVEARLVILDQTATDPDAGTLRPSPFTAPGCQSSALSTHPAEDYMVDVVHESLIRSWSQLRQWLAACRPALLQQRRLEAAALEWHNLGSPVHPEYLLQGQLLQTALELQQQHWQWLSAHTRSYIHISQQQARQYQLKGWIVRCLVPLSIGAGMFSAYSYYHLSQQVAHQSTPSAESILRRNSHSELKLPQGQFSWPYLLEDFESKPSSTVLFNPKPEAEDPTSSW